MSVLPDAGNNLPVDSDRAVVVSVAPVDEAMDNALDAIGLHVGQLWFRTDSQGVLPLMIDEHSMVCDFVWPDAVPVVQACMSVAMTDFHLG